MTNLFGGDFGLGNRHGSAAGLPEGTTGSTQVDPRLLGGLIGFTALVILTYAYFLGLFSVTKSHAHHQVHVGEAVGNGAMGARGAINANSQHLRARHAPVAPPSSDSEMHDNESGDDGGGDYEHEVSDERVAGLQGLRYRGAGGHALRKAKLKQQKEKKREERQAYNAQIAEERRRRLQEQDELAAEHELEERRREAAALAREQREKLGWAHYILPSGLAAKVMAGYHGTSSTPPPLSLTSASARREASKAAQRAAAEERRARVVRTVLDWECGTVRVDDVAHMCDVPREEVLCIISDSIAQTDAAAAQATSRHSVHAPQLTQWATLHTDGQNGACRQDNQAPDVQGMSDAKGQVGAPTHQEQGGVAAVSVSLDGVLDNQGVFVPLRPGELDAIAAIIKNRGLLSSDELVVECNRILRENDEKMMGGSVDGDPDSE